MQGEASSFINLPHHFLLPFSLIPLTTLLLLPPFLIIHTSHQKQMSYTQAMAVYIPHLVSAPLLPLALLAITVLALSTHSAADTTVQERQMQRQKEESGESVALTKVHAIGFGFMASLGLLAMWMWSNVLGKQRLFRIPLLGRVVKRRRRCGEAST